MQPDLLTDLAKRLFDLRPTGIFVPFREVGFRDKSGVRAPDDWSPKPHACYANVDTWVRMCPDYRAIRGWVAFDQTMLRPPKFHFAAHSVLQFPDGTLFDITPSGVSIPYPFIRHPGTNEEFDALRQHHQIMFIDHYLCN
jgi:hypothetical protein